MSVLPNPPRGFRRSLAIFLALAHSGCGIYLHDAGIQQQTLKAQETFKSIDVPAAFKTVREAEATLAAVELKSVAAGDSAIRDEAAVRLVTSPPPPEKRSATSRLDAAVRQRLQELGSKELQDFGAWTDLRAKQIQIETNQGELQAVLDAFVAQFKKEGGSFQSCEDFQVPDAPPERQKAGELVKGKCEELAKNAEQLDVVRGPVQSLIAAAPNGQIATVHNELVLARSQLDEQVNVLKTTKKNLAAAKGALDQATRAAGKIDSTVEESFKRLDGLLKSADQAANVLGAPSPGAALAAAEFRKVSVRDVISAAGNLPSDPTQDTEAQKTARAITGIIIGLKTLEEAKRDTAPTLGELGIALAFAEGLEAIAQIDMDALTQQVALLQEQEEALVREYELLVRAKVSLNQLTTLAGSDACDGYPGFGALFRECKSSLARLSAARALSAYNLSWASGKTPARLAYNKQTQLNRAITLRHAEQAAVARTKILSLALTSAANYGAGGIKPETIALFIQALATVAIAKGVN